MTSVILSAILFVMILFVCFIAFVGGLYLGLRYKEKPPEIKLTETEIKEIEKRKRQEENFWNFDG